MRAAPGPVEWLTFPDPDDPDHQFRVNVSFMLELRYPAAGAQD
jgi:hypothetical protein